MIIERTSNQIVIKVSLNIDSFGFQRIMDYLEYLEITSKSKATQEDSDKLAKEYNEILKGTADFIEMDETEQRLENVIIKHENSGEAI